MKKMELKEELGRSVYTENKCVHRLAKRKRIGQKMN
jgi:hypothetical protein